jgi:signal transduction histidine kinase
MNKIIKASNEEFLVFEVCNKEMYSKDIIEYINNYYTEKMNINNIDFDVLKYKNCMIFGDVERAIEVVQNVIENAVKYGDGRKIVLEAVKEEEEYHIVVRNTGCTLSENELTHIFESFYRGSNTESQNGSGLGLYICRSLMHLMEGEILARIINDPYENWLEVRMIFRVI